MIRYEEWQLEDFMDEFREEIEDGEIEEERCRVAVCKTSPLGDRWRPDIQLNLVEVVETTIYKYEHEKVLLVDPNDDSKGFVVFEAIFGKTLDGLLELSDYDLVDDKIKDLSNVDLYLTSNEFIDFK